MVDYSIQISIFFSSSVSLDRCCETVMLSASKEADEACCEKKARVLL